MNNPTIPPLSYAFTKAFSGFLFLPVFALLALGCSGPTENMDRVALEPTPIYRNNTKPPTPPQQKVVDRQTLHQTLAQGVGRFLQRVRLLPYRHNGKFIGFQIHTLFPGENIRIDAPLIGDVILRVNGSRIDRPDQLQKVWESLYTANVITIEYWRQGLVYTTSFPISN